MIDLNDIDVDEDAFAIDAADVLALVDIRALLADESRPIDRVALANAIGDVLENCERLS